MSVKISIHVSPDVSSAQRDQPISLAGTEDPSYRSYWGCLKWRKGRNLSNVVLAGGLSTAGVCLAGFVPTTAGILAGGALAGIGNGVSTWLDWEKKTRYVIKKELVDEFPRLVSRVDALSRAIAALPISGEELKQSSLKQEASSFWNARNGRNSIRLFIAGSLSAAGGLLAGFVPVSGGIIAGALLSGIGNGVSTGLYLEEKDDAQIEKCATEEMPTLAASIDECEKKLGELISKIPSPLSQAEEQSVDRCPFSKRNGRNFYSVNAAGWTSAAGGWLGGFVPTTAGILGGSAASAIGNMISTVWIWERPEDQKIKQVALKDFLALTQKVDRLKREISKLTEMAQLRETA